MKHSSRIGPDRVGIFDFSLSPFDPREVKNHASPANMPTNADPVRLCRARLQAGTVCASRCSPEGERYDAGPISHPNGGAH